MKISGYTNILYFTAIKHIFCSHGKNLLSLNHDLEMQNELEYLKPHGCCGMQFEEQVLQSVKHPNLIIS